MRSPPAKICAGKLALVIFSFTIRSLIHKFQKCGYSWLKFALLCFAIASSNA
ncbi:hypothetical protein COI_0214 [Mannheimia haemolytica serotype A2 str. OVINE]|nr:hypothetical protein COI_0214 [Mannheimia haemolytica serotype A2 str. OVINE]